jgi:CubicO group peptidase (beta-lactamase class C family)
MKVLPIFPAILSLSLMGTLSCSPGREAGNGLSPSAIVAGETGRSIDEFLSRLSGFGYQGAMLVVRRGDVVLRKGYGPANRDAHVANAPDTLLTSGPSSRPSPRRPFSSSKPRAGQKSRGAPATETAWSLHNLGDLR